MATRLCVRCGRVNPPGALYCCHDGSVLAADTKLGPINAGALPFATPFVFPSGRVCANFDELVQAIEDNWDEALQLFIEGRLTTFFGLIEREDLVSASKLGVSPNPQRGLSDLLERLPSDARRAPRLYIQPKEFSLGVIDRHETRRLLVVIRNQGKGLLHGTIVTDHAPWLILGDPPGVASKLFECRDEIVLRVQLVGDRMRAGDKGANGALLIDSNGGSVTIPIRSQRPSKPFVGGLLDGARSPRQLAEKARAKPREAVACFESGAVRAWYATNSWPWPIKGDQATGIGAVQQFFEALGLTSPPRVQASELFVPFEGRPGETHYHTLKLTTQENRPVYAFTWSDSPWLKVERSHPSGKSVRIQLEATIPAQPGETQLGRVEIVANGGQRIVVVASVTVSGAPLPTTQLLPAQEGSMELLDEGSVKPLPPEVALTPLRPSVPSDVNLLDLETDEPSGPSPRPAAPLSPPHWRSLAGLALVVLALLGTLLHDALLPAGYVDVVETPNRLELLDPEAVVSLRWHDGPKPIQPGLMPQPTMRFGVVLPRDKDVNDPGRLCRLTADEWGRSNSTRVRVDDQEVVFGEPPGEWVVQKRPRGVDPVRNKTIDGLDSVWRYQGLDVTQSVEVVAGLQTWRLDTCLVRYTLENRGDQELQVGLSVLLDTYLGSTDGVPFTLPLRAELCSTKHVYPSRKTVPDFIEAVERATFLAPGTVLRLNLKVGTRLEAPSRVQLNVKPDSNVTLTWDEKTLEPGRKREVGFSLSAGRPAVDELGKLLVSVGGRFVPGGEFTVTAVAGSMKNETLTLNVPTGLRLMAGSEGTQLVPPIPEKADRKASVVTWRLKATEVGKFTLDVQRGAVSALTVPIHIHPPQTENEVFD